jgi:hypothetical protein
LTDSFCFNNWETICSKDWLVAYEMYLPSTMWLRSNISCQSFLLFAFAHFRFQKDVPGTLVQPKMPTMSTSSLTAEHLRRPFHLNGSTLCFHHHTIHQPGYAHQQTAQSQLPLTSTFNSRQVTNLPTFPVHPKRRTTSPHHHTQSPAHIRIQMNRSLKMRT